MFVDCPPCILILGCWKNFPACYNFWLSICFFSFIGISVNFLVLSFDSRESTWLLILRLHKVFGSRIVTRLDSRITVKMEEEIISGLFGEVSYAKVSLGGFFFKKKLRFLYISFSCSVLLSLFLDDFLYTCTAEIFLLPFLLSTIDLKAMLHPIHFLQIAKFLPVSL